MDVEAVALVLGEDHDAAVPAVDEIREREIDQPVVAAEWDCRFGPIPGQGHQALALAAGQDHRQDLGATHTASTAPGRRLMSPARVPDTDSPATNGGSVVGDEPPGQDPQHGESEPRLCLQQLVE